jgi:hypothetical protein
VLVSRDCNAPAAAHCVKKLFRSTTDTVDLSVPQAQGIRSTEKKFQRSREHHERFAELDIVHNQAFTHSPPQSTPPPPLLPPAPAARAPPAPQLLPEKKVKIIALEKAFPSYHEQAVAAGKPAPDLGPGAGPAGNRRHRVRYRETRLNDQPIS